MKKLLVALIILFSLFLLFACNSSSGLNGEYVCTEHYSEGMVGQISLEFNKDGTVLMQPLNSEGDYTVEGNTVTIELEQFDLTFTKDGDTLTSSDKTVVYEKK